MSHPRFLLCRSCAVLQQLGTPEADLSPEAREEATIELRVFESEHAGHALEEVVRCSASSTLDRPAWDPMATLWFFVRSGADELLVRASRSTIEEPRCYQLDPEPPQNEGQVEIDAGLVRRALDEHFYPQAIAARKLDHFVDLLCVLVADLDPATIETSFDDPDYADAGMAPLPEGLCRSLLERSTPIFDPWELERLAAFIAAHCRAEGVLGLRVHRALAALSA